MPPAAIKTRAHYHYLAASMRTLEADLRWGMEGSERIPDEWHSIAQADTPPNKLQVTLWLGADVVTFFRSMGAGHLTRMNAVLRAFMHGRWAGVVKGAVAVGYKPTPMEAYLSEAAFVLALMERHNAKGRLGRDTASTGSVAQIAGDSLFDSKVLIGMHEQTPTSDLPHDELALL